MTLETSAILARNIRKRREALGLNINRASLMAQVRFNTWKSWELQLCAPRMHHLADIARVLGCSVADLFVNPDEPPSTAA